LSCIVAAAVIAATVQEGQQWQIRARILLSDCREASAQPGGAASHAAPDLEGAATPAAWHFALDHCDGSSILDVD
jgi:hypothetical protein